MSALTPLIKLENQNEWDALALASRAHLLQTFAWGELKAKFGWRVERLAFRDGEKIHTGAQILYRQLAPALTIAYIPRGPFGNNPATLAKFFDALKQHTRTHHAFLFKTEPDWQPDDARVKILRAADAHAATETIQPAATIHIDLTADLDTILARMKSKWRYNIRLAEKKNVVVRAGTRADMPAFYDLMQITGTRDQFAIHGQNYYAAAFDLLTARDHAQLFIAEFQKRPLAMIFVTAFADEAIYLYGASSNLERNRMPNHALHWTAMQWAKARGCTRYDLWGIPSMNETSAAENLAAENLPPSLYQFKQGFGGQVVRYTGAYDFIFNAPRFQLYQLARKLRKSRIG